MRVRVKLDRRGLATVGRSSGMERALLEAADAVADNIRAMGIRVEHIPGDIDLPVETELVGGNDTATALVTLLHPSGQATQAKDGPLTKGAAEAGLRVGG